MGADKFIHLLIHLERYLNPSINSLLFVPASSFMMIVEIIEIIAGILLLIRT
jgi:hypothetical protein